MLPVIDVGAIAILIAISGATVFQANYLLIRLIIKGIWAITVIYFFLRGYQVIDMIINKIYEYIDLLVSYANQDFSWFDWANCLGITTIIKQFLPMFDFLLNTFLSTLLVIIIIKVSGHLFKIFATS